MSLNFELNKKSNYNKKYVPNSDIKIEYLNPNLNEKENRILTNNFIESPFDLDFDSDELETKKISGQTGEENNPTKENNEFLDILDEEDETLFYDERKEKNERAKVFEGWIKKIKHYDMVNDFHELKQKNTNKMGDVSDLYFTLHKDENIKKEMRLHIKKSY